MNTYFEDIGVWPNGGEGNAATYALGFALSLACTLLAFFFVFEHVHTQHLWPTHGFLYVLLPVLAIVQVAVQLIAFLHLDFSRRSRSRLAALGAVLIVITILVSGSLWIMHWLNVRMMPSPQVMEQYMHNEGGGF